MKTLVIGASGLLGRELVPLLEGEILTPTHQELDICDYWSIGEYIKGKEFSQCVLLAAYTDVKNANTGDGKSLCRNTNIDGIRSLIFQLQDNFAEKDRPRLTFISSDYVFKGDTGGYKVTDIADPIANNYYAYTKAVGEELIFMYEGYSTIIRTSFVPSDKWLHETAFTDKYTSADKVSVIAPMIAKVINKINPIMDDYLTVHIGTERKSVYELAKTIDPNVKPSSRLDIKGVNLPYDTSLELTNLDWSE